MVEIFAIKKVSERTFEKYKNSLLEHLPPDSVSYVNRFRKRGDLQRSLLGESMARACLSKRTGIEPASLRIIRSEKGKPYLIDEKNVHFNISHSGDWVVVAISDKEVGIDVEKIRDPEYRIAERFFSPQELDQLETLSGEEKMNRFFELWTLKESYLKLLGKGLTQSLGSFSVIKEADQNMLFLNGKQERSIYFHQHKPAPGYLISVCSYKQEISHSINLILLDELLNLLNYGKQ